MGNTTLPCSEGWIFDTSTFGSSAVMDWSLVCQYKSMRATAQVTVTVTVTLTVLQALFMAGVMFGSYTFGWLSDKFGRKPSFFIAVVIQVTHLSTALPASVRGRGEAWGKSQRSHWSRPIAPG